MTTLVEEPKTVETIFTSKWHPKKADNFKCLRRWGVSLNHEGKTVWIWEQLKTYFPSPAKKKKNPKFEPVPRPHEAKLVPAFDPVFASYNPIAESSYETASTYTQWTAKGLEAARKRGDFWLCHSKPKPLMILSFKRRLPALYTMVEGKGWNPRTKKQAKITLCHNHTWNPSGYFGVISRNNEDRFQMERQLTKGACTLLDLVWEDRGFDEKQPHQLYEILRPTIVERFGKRLVLDQVPKSVRILINEHSFKRGIKKLTGNKGKKTQRLVVQCVQNQQYLNLELVYFARGTLTIDDIHKLLERQRDRGDGDNPYRHRLNMHIPQIRRWAKRVPLNHLKSWLMTCHSMDYLHDCLAAIARLDEEEINWSQIPRNLTEAHNVMCARANNRDKLINREKKLKAPKKWQEINGTEIVTNDGVILKFTLPETMGDVYDWGEHQQHCIGMYAADHLRKVSVLIQIEAPKKTHYHLQVYNERKEMGQFYGKANTPVPNEIIGAVQAFLRDKKLLNKTSYSYAPGVYTYTLNVALPVGSMVTTDMIV